MGYGDEFRVSGLSFAEVFDSAVGAVSQFFSFISSEGEVGLWGFSVLFEGIPGNGFVFVKAFESMIQAGVVDGCGGVGCVIKDCRWVFVIEHEFELECIHSFFLPSLYTYQGI